MLGKTDFLRINAFAIRDLIKQKLSQDTRFTDQIFDGSNLAILIDIFSYIAQILIYQLNNAASESMFIDTQMYENINRLCNFIGYDPKGAAPSTVTAILNREDVERWKETHERISLCKYSYVNTGKSDNTGRQIVYSVGNSDINPAAVYGVETSDYKTILYNGMWKLYTTVFVATGDPWETFVLENLKSDANLNQYVAHGFIDVYAVVYADNDTKSSIDKIYKFNYTDRQLFRPPVENDLEKYLSDVDSSNSSSKNKGVGETSFNRLIYQGSLNNKQDRVFNLRLNENKQYQITFGDGATGAIPPKGASLYIVYLESNGPFGEIEVGDIKDAPLTLNALGMTPQLQNAVFFGQTGDEYDERSSSETYFAVRLTNSTPSTVAKKEESVQEIKDSAPNWFKMGNRLVTKDDYEYYIMNSPYTRGTFSDVKAMNNWEYISTFYKWLFDLGTRFHGDPRYYLNQNRLVKNDYQIADPADCNNIYLWCCRGFDTESGDNDVALSELTDGLKRSFKPIKDMTHEPIFLEAIPVYFGICAASSSTAYQFIRTEEPPADFNGVSTRSYFEITIDDVSFYSSSTIARQVEGKIRKFFKECSKHIGGFVNFNNLLTDIMDIEGIVNVRTVYIPVDDNNARMTYSPIVQNGLCFASWTGGLDNLIDIGIDMEVSNTGRSLEQFQYPKLASVDSLINAIKIIRKSMNTIERVQY